VTVDDNGFWLIGFIVSVVLIVVLAKHAGDEEIGRG
jgi:hypothetical protein